jgi:hypothetical protein
MGSVLERFSDSQLNKYMKYFTTIVTNTFSDIDDFYQNIMWDKQIRNKLRAPLGIPDLDRLDIEYFYYLLENNPEGGPYDDRPQLEEQEVNWVTRERVYVERTHTGEIETYIVGSLDSSYLNTLKDEDEIDPWGWEETDRDEDDGDMIDDWFDV